MPKRWLCISVLLLFCAAASALQRQPDADYKARRGELSKKVAGIVVLFGSLEPVESLYSFRQDDDFYYLSGWAEPGAALLIAPAVEAGDKNTARPYTEILFSASAQCSNGAFYRTQTGSR
jgi:Xaa-Pro aminopeptidase